MAALLLVTGCSVNPPLKLADTVDLDAPVELTEVPFHPQQAHHCGPASLLTLLEHSGVSTDYDAVVRRIYVPGLEGSLQLEMLATGRQFGRLTYPLPPDPAALFAEVAAGRPVLVLLNLGVPSSPRWHYAVVVGFDPQRNRIFMRSGTEPRRVRKAPVWLRQWDWAGRWAMVSLRPGEWPAQSQQPEQPHRERLLQSLADFEDSAPAEDVEKSWRTATLHWPYEPLAWLGLGNAAHRLEDWNRAQAAYRRALEFDPENLPARLNLALTLQEIGQACEGLEELHSPPSADHPLSTAFAELRETLGQQCEEDGS